MTGQTVDVQIRRAIESDSDAVQRLWKQAWRARYAHPETGVTRSVLEDELAVLPPTQEDLDRYRAMLAEPANTWQPGGGGGPGDRGHGHLRSHQ